METDKIVVYKKNEASLLLGCDYGIAAELSDYFSFFVPGYKWMPSFKNKVWDGKIRIFNALTKEFPVGLLPYLKSFAEKRNYILDYEDGPYGPPETFNKVDPKEIMDFVKELNLHSRGNPLEIRDYQFDAVCEAIRRKRVILLSPTGSGKSLIIYTLLRWYLKHYDHKVLVIVPTTSLVEQMYADFKDYSGNDPEFNAEDDCHVIYSGQPKTAIQERVFISTWQSIYKLPATWFAQFGAIFGDECHLFKSKSLSSIMNKSKDVAYRFGTTGTLDGSQCFTHDMKVTTDAGIKNISDIKIGDVVLSYNEETKKKEYADVINVYNNGKVDDGEILVIKTQDGTIKCTKDHLLYTTNRGWIKAKDLTLNDILFHS